MSKLPDIAEFFTPDRALNEEILWILGKPWQPRLEFMKPFLEEYQIKSIVEFGCRSGLLAEQLPKDIQYTGFEKNKWFLQKARARNNLNKNMRFPDWDEIAWGFGNPMLAMSWDDLKHRSLEDFDDDLALTINGRDNAAFNVQLCDEEFDDGEKYHHSFVNLARVEKIVKDCQHIVRSCVFYKEWEHGSGRKCLEAYFWTHQQETPDAS